jgi:hypothetical protein
MFLLATTKVAVFFFVVYTPTPQLRSWKIKFFILHQIIEQMWLDKRVVP